MSEFILDDLSNKVFALMPTLPECEYSIARIDYLKINKETLNSMLEKITKEEFLRRFADAEKSIVVLSANADNSNYFEEYKNGLHAIKCGDAYIKDGRERVVVGVDGNYVELNDNASRE